MTDNGPDPTDPDAWRWYKSRTGNKTHLLPAGADRTLCGLQPGPDERVADVKAYLGTVVPRHRATCSQCRAGYCRALLDRADYALDDFSEGDVIRFWTGQPRESSDPSPLRKVGVVEELPPYSLGPENDPRTREITDRLYVAEDPVMHYSVAPENVYAIVAHDADASDLGESELTKGLRRVLARQGDR